MQMVYNLLGFISYSLWVLIFSLSHFMTLETFYFPNCNRILQHENQKLFLFLLLASVLFCYFIRVSAATFALYKSLSALCLIHVFSCLANVPLSPQKAVCFPPVFCLMLPISAPNSKVIIHLVFKTHSLIISLMLSHFSPSCFQNFAGLPAPNAYHCALIYSLMHLFKMAVKPYLSAFLLLLLVYLPRSL